MRAILAISLCLGLVQSGTFAGMGPEPQAWAAPSPGYRVDRIIIQPKAGVSPEIIEALHAYHHTKVLQSIENMGRLQVITVPAGETVADLVGKYRASGMVQFAEPDYLVQAATVPNDPQFLDGTQWGLNAINAPGGWDVITSASNIVVAVVDTGVRYSHEDLTNNMWINPVNGGHGLNVLTGTNDPFDDSGHGTRVAGILGAVGNNGLGIAGVAWTVQILGCKSLDQFGVGSTSDCITCLDYARTNNARIINASWGDTNSLALSNAVYSLRDAGIILVAAAGNIPTNVDVQPTYPACYHLDNVVSVASSMPDDTLAPRSNYGATNVHLAAPGYQIYSTFAASDHYYDSESGTSFAAPFVSGALALVLAQYAGEPYQETISRVLNATDPVPSLVGKCVTGGRLNLKNALSPFVRLVALPAVAGVSFQLHVLGSPHLSCVIQAAPDLAAWLPVYTNTIPDGGGFDFLDPNSTNPTTRFYRVVASP